MAMQGNEGKSGKGDNRKKSGPPSELSSLDFTGGGDAWALAQCAEKVQVLEGGDALMAVIAERVVAERAENQTEVDRLTGEQDRLIANMKRLAAA